VTTDRIITVSRVPSAQSSVQGAKQRVAAVPLAWSAALRVSREIIIQTTIDVGRSRYWRNLWSNLDFADQRLKDCVNIIHVDIVEIWNLKDKSGYLSSDIFKAKMSHLVKDLDAGPSAGSKKKKEKAGSASAMSGFRPLGAGHEFAQWVRYLYMGSLENVCCVMGYIVDLTIILDEIFRTADGDIMSQNDTESIFQNYWTGRSVKIHSDIQNIVKETYPLRLTAQKDIFLEKVDDLIKQYCVPC